MLRRERRKSERLAIVDRYCELADQVLHPVHNPTREQAKELVEQAQMQLRLMRQLRAEMLHQVEQARKAAAAARKRLTKKALAKKSLNTRRNKKR